MESSNAARGRRSLALPLCAAALTVCSAEAALAANAGNTVVRNTITVNYSDAKGNAQSAVSATVDMIVSTVAATPTILAYTPASGNTDGTGSTQDYTVRIRTNSNGPGLVTLGAADTASTNMGGYGAAPFGLPASVFLGSTAIDPSDTNGTIASWGAGASLTFKVPNDGGVPSDSAVSGGTANDGAVNALKNGDVVYLYSGSTYYGPFRVGTVTEVPVGTGATAAPCSIQLINNLGAGALTNLATGAGWQIIEAKDAGMTVTQGSVTDPTAPATWTTTVTATMAGAAAASTPTVVTNAHMGKIDLKKYVRNVTTPGGTGTAFTPPVSINGAANTFYTNGVTGKPGEVLEYLVVLTDTGSGDAKGVYATDTLPTYATLVSATSYGGTSAGKIFARAKFNNLETDLNSDNSGGLVNVAYGSATGSPTTMTFWLGTGCTTTAGGTLNTSLPTAQATSTTYVVYQVKIN